ncbi:MAG: ROK family protein [Candidatus Woesearchaeota archaeon]
MKLVGLDVGGTKIEGVIFDKNLRILKRLRRPTRSGKTPLENIISVAKYLLAGKKYPLGVSMAGYEGNFGMPNIRELVGIDIAKVLSKRLGVPVAIENDAHCFALGECVIGAGIGTKNMVGVILGTGVGGGAVVDGLLIKGKDHAAAHFGHMIIDPSGPMCNCGQKGDFESWCSGPHIVKRYVAAGGKIKNPDPKKIFSSKEKVAKKIVEETYEKLAIGFANIINLYNPEIIVVGGGLSNLPIYEKLNKLVKKYCTLGLERNVQIVKNKLGDSAGVYGAALIALKPGSF